LPLLSAGVSTRRAVRPVLVCAFGMMGLVVVNQEFGLPSIDTYLIENRRDPEGAKDNTVKGAWDMNNVYVGGQSAVKKDMLIRDFIAIIPKEMGQGSMRTLQAAEARYVPPSAGDKRSGGWILSKTKPDELPNWVENQDDILVPQGSGKYFLKTRDVDFNTLMRVKNWFLYLPTWKLAEELDRPNNSGRVLGDLAIAFHTRLTRPAVGIILVLLGLSVILRDQNRNVFISAGLCLILCVVFFLSIFTCQYFAKGEAPMLSPALAAWLPVLVFGPASFVMFADVHT
jgi:lipopolysaccharide export system permease protein